MMVNMNKMKKIIGTSAPSAKRNISSNKQENLKAAVKASPMSKPKAAVSPPKVAAKVKESPMQMVMSRTPSQPARRQSPVSTIVQAAQRRKRS